MLIGKMKIGDGAVIEYTDEEGEVFTKIYTESEMDRYEIDIQQIYNLQQAGEKDSVIWRNLF